MEQRDTQFMQTGMDRDTYKHVCTCTQNGTHVGMNLPLCIHGQTQVQADPHLSPYMHTVAEIRHTQIYRASYTFYLHHPDIHTQSQTHNHTRTQGFTYHKGSNSFLFICVCCIKVEKQAFLLGIGQCYGFINKGREEIT